MDKAEFKNRFIAKMTSIMGQYEPYFEFAAKASWDMYVKCPDDMTPEECADSEYDCWGSNL
jgi:hypothetical protein